MLALDSETTGLDLHHGARPFYVTTCDERGVIRSWFWPVDPHTRMPAIDPADLKEIEQLLDSHDTLILQNAKFDFTALELAGLPMGRFWPKVRDTLRGAHLLASGFPKNLTALALQYLGKDIAPKEEALKKACIAARRIAKAERPLWRTAREGLGEMPSAGEETWGYDMWLPAVVAEESGYAEDHPWRTVMSAYSDVDSEVTLAIWLRMEKEIKQRKLGAICDECHKAYPVAWAMEMRGVTINSAALDRLMEVYKRQSAEKEHELLYLASKYNYKLTLPKGSSVNNSLRTFCFDVLKLPPLRSKKSKTDVPTLDKDALDSYEAYLPEGGDGLFFVKTLRALRKKNKSLTDMVSYKSFWVPLDIWNEKGEQLWYRIYPSLNPTGTATLRWSCSNPNDQNISKLPDEEGYTLRSCFGPEPGREWWSKDAKNIELRIPAYECGEEAFIKLFEHPDDPPYFGSNHLLVAHILHPKQFEECVNEKGELDGRIFKKRYASTLYQWVKNGNFAVQYGAIDREDGEGTADRAYHMPGAQAKIKARFTKQEALNQYWIRYAEKHGYVETMADKTVDPERGYPLLCTRTERGNIKPTVPLNYHVQGTAMWWMMKAMIRVDAFYERLNAGEEFAGQAWPGGYYLILQVHDELVSDMPAGSLFTHGDPALYNLPVVREVQRLMELGGDDIGLPTPVSAEYHAESWGEGRSM